LIQIFLITRSTTKEITSICEEMSELTQREKAVERKRRQRELDREDSARKSRKLDTVFLFENFKVNIIVDIDGRIWFKGKDIARALGIVKISHILHNLFLRKPNSVIKFKDVTMVHKMSHCDIHPETLFITEGAMNSLLIRSHKPEAAKFHDWITDEVLPQIRTHHVYEIRPEENPYRELNDILESQNVELEAEDQNEENPYRELDDFLELQNVELEAGDQNDFEMQEINQNLKVKLRSKETELQEKDVLLQQKDTAIIELSKQNEEKLQEKDAILCEKDNQLQRKDALLQQKDNQLQQKDAVIIEISREKDILLCEKDNQLQQKDNLLLQKDNKLQRKKAKIAKKKGLISCLSDKVLFLRKHYVPPNKKQSRKEYFTIIAVNSNCFKGRIAPYYALRIQERFFEERIERLKTKYPNLEVLLKLESANSVNLFNRIKEQIPGIQMYYLNQFDSTVLDRDELLDAIIELHLYPV
jgi:prophage antirepressor-like protein